MIVANQTRQSRFGITLIEIVIVMSILVLLGMFALPSIGRSFTGQKLNKAADLVRNQLNRARVQSMRTGKIHAFFYMNDSSQFKVATFDAEVARILSKSFQRRNQSNTSSTFDVGGQQLPSGIKFFNGESLTDSRSAAAVVEDNIQIDNNFRPVLFYPDGSSQTARLYLRSDDDEYAEIRVRGMTGTSTSAVVDVGR